MARSGIIKNRFFVHIDHMCDLSVHPRASVVGIHFRGILGGVQSSGKTQKTGLGSPTRPWGTTTSHPAFARATTPATLSTVLTKVIRSPLKRREHLKRFLVQVR